jgi:hypothetical protein
MLHMTARVIWGPLKFPTGHDHGHGHLPLPHGAAMYDVHADPGHAGHTGSVMSHGTAAGHQADHGQAATPGGKHTSRHYHGDDTGDLTGREIGILAPLAVAVVLLGVLPTPMLDSILRPIQALRTPVEGAPALAATDPQPSAAVATAGNAVDPNP